MKKLLITAALLAGVTIGIAKAGFFGRGCCPQTACAPVCAPACPAPVKPICTKTITVQKVINVPQVVTVPAVEVRMPQAPLTRCIAQPPRRICIKQPPIPQPDIIKYECVPDKIELIPQPDIIRYECPVGTTASNGCGC